MKIKVYVFGDSIAFGQYVSPHRTWVTRMAAHMGEGQGLSGLNVIVQNPSRNGETTEMALQRVEYDVYAHNPDIVIVQFGLNDCNVWETGAGHPRVAPSAFKENLITICTGALESGATQVFLNTNHQTTRTETLLPGTDYSYEQSNVHYNELIRNVAAVMEGVSLIDIANAVDPYLDRAGKVSADLVLDDGLHLSEVGHKFYFETVTPIVAGSLTDGLKERG